MKGEIASYGFSNTGDENRKFVFLDTINMYGTVYKHVPREWVPALHHAASLYRVSREEGGASVSSPKGLFELLFTIPALKSSLGVIPESSLDNRYTPRFGPHSP